MSSFWLNGLNPEQAEAAKHDHGPMLILAGAGSGKTTVLVHRTGRLIHEEIAKPAEILVLTFTNKAARELKTRVSDKLGPMAKKIHASTFHALGLEILKRNYKAAQLPKKFGIVDASDSVAILKEEMSNIKHADKGDFDANNLFEIMSKMRSGQTDFGGVEEAYVDVAEAVLPKYLGRLKALGVVDFEGLILKPIELFEDNSEILEFYHRKYKQFMVDEFQDTNDTQMRLIKLLAKESNNLTVVGDDDQSIYGWRGAEIQHILDFPKRFKGCKTVQLVRNYRSKKKILDIANEVIQHNASRHKKQLIAAGHEDDGELPELFVYGDELDEAENIVSQIRYFVGKDYQRHEICILYRSNMQSGIIEAQLRQHDIPYKVTGGTAFFSRKEVKDVLAYLKCMCRPNELSFRRILNTPPRGLGQKVIEEITLRSEQQQVSFFQAAKQFEFLDIPANAREELKSLFEKIQSGKEQLLNGAAGAADELARMLIDWGYQKHIYKGFKDPHTAKKRWDLIETFARVLEAFFNQTGRNEETLLSFLEKMELGDQVDEKVQRFEVQLMTLHACKGLEFPVVILLGIEEDLLPHQRLGSNIDEERRLFYVGITRAKHHLILTRAMKRKRRGKVMPSSPSRFLLQIPEALYTDHQGPFRPITEIDRKSLVSSLFDKIDKNPIKAV